MSVKDFSEQSWDGFTEDADDGREDKKDEFSSAIEESEEKEGE